MDENVHLRENFVYGNVDQQLLYIKIYKNFWDLREQILKEQSDENHQK